MKVGPLKWQSLFVPWAWACFRFGNYQTDGRNFCNKIRVILVLNENYNDFGLVGFRRRIKNVKVNGSLYY